jgi:cell division septation protein DedD
MRTDVVKYIPELLSRYDCVIIPGFGGFIGNYSPAVINPVYHTFYPPFKSLLFNIHLKQNDGLLASFISHAEHIPYDQAVDDIRMMVEEWNEALENGKELIINKIGRIIVESEDILQFEQDPSVNFLPEAYGLTSLVSPAIRRQGMQDKLEKKLDHYIHAPHGKSRKLGRSLKWAAMMALPVGLAVYLSITNMDQIRSFHENYSGFLFPSSTSSPAPSKKIVVPKIIPAAVKPTEKIIPVKTEVAETTGTAVTKPYAIIVGAFRFRENADNLVAKLKDEGYNAGIFDTTTTGLFRVSVDTFSNKDEAIAQLAVVRSNNYSSAWLLSK